MGQYTYVKIVCLFSIFFMQGSAWLVEYHDDNPVSWTDAAARCSALGGVLATSKDQSCFMDLKSGWIGKDTGNVSVNNNCGYFNGLTTSTTSCSTLLPFYCKTYAIGKINTIGSQRRLSSLNIKIENHSSFRIRLQTCAMSEMSFQTVPGNAVYTVRIGEQNSEKYRNIITYKTEGPNTELVDSSVISFNDTCDKYQWFSVAWKEDSGENFLYFYHGQNMEVAELASVANMTFRSVSDVTLSSYVGKATWYIYAPTFYGTSVFVNDDKLINISPKPNILAFEFKSCHFAKITVMSGNGYYTYSILIEGIAEPEGRSIYIRDTTTNNVTRRIFTEDKEECSNYRFYWINLIEEGDDVHILISRNFEEFHRAVLLSDSDRNDMNVVMFYGVLRDSRIEEQPTSTSLGEWNFYSNDITCYKENSAIGSTLPSPSPIRTVPKAVTTEPSGVKTKSPITIDIPTDAKRPVPNKPMSSSMEENEHGKRVQMIAIGVGSAVLLLVGLGILITWFIMKSRVHKNKLDDHHHRKSLAGIVFPSDVTLSPISLSRLHHTENNDNVYNACAQEGRLQLSYGGHQNYLTMDDDAGQGHERRRREQSHFKDSIENINLDERDEDHLYQKI